MAQVDLDDGWTALDDLVALHTADDAGELRRRLLLFEKGGGNKAADAFEPWCLLHKAHADEPEGAVATALLLLTDRRWRNATGRLVRRIEESGLVPGEHLDLLAQTFLAAGPQLYWEAPGDWFTGPAIVLHTDDTDDADAVDEPGDPEDGPVVFPREVRPPLRRWAAGRTVRSDPASWGALVQRARQVDPRAGAAIIHGLIDGVDVLTPEARDVVIVLAQSWPQRQVREAVAALPNAPAPARVSVEIARQGAPAPSTAQPSLF